MVTLVFMCLITFAVLIALESSCNAMSKVMAEIEFFLFGQIMNEDLTIYQSKESKAFEQNTIIKYGRIIAQKQFEEIEQKITHHINLINQINTPTITTQILSEYDEPKTQSNRTSFAYIEEFFEDLAFERQFKEQVEYA